uniref:Putative secreted protein n=1 Tax=Anopheles marajoara TaxID=58244 RepID=A0A2M4CF50_9DIPT
MLSCFLCLVVYVVRSGLLALTHRGLIPRVYVAESPRVEMMSSRSSKIAMSLDEFGSVQRANGCGKWS